jgi:thioredoxin reductase (NADPH)
MSDIHNVVIIGSGPAAYTAAIYTGRANLKPLIIGGYIYGGQLMITSEVENFPGFTNGIKGPELMKNMHQQSEKFGAKFIATDCSSIDTTNRPFIVHTQDGDSILTKSIIIATGAKSAWLNAEGEDELKGRGISTCATCDGSFFKNVPIIVVGGGDSAMEEAIFLTRFASKVYIIHRKNTFRASKILYERALLNSKIEIKTPYTIKKWNIDENNNLKSASIINAETNDEDILECKGAFIAIGHTPSSKFIKEAIETDKNGYIILKQNTSTSIDGIFACGDVCDNRYKQAITAAGSGCMAAIDCAAWLENN